MFRKPFAFVGVACLSLLATGLVCAPSAAQTPAQLEKQRNKLVDEVLVQGGIDNKRVLQAMRTTLRHEFVESQHRPNAYFDMSLPIGEKQTISGPFIVAYMTQSLDPQPTDKVLEIGTGSGYQAAVLSPLVKEVYSIEILKPLGTRAAQVLKKLKYENVFTKIGDGFLGWEEHAPFDKIIVTCSPEKVPQPLVDQLVEGGLMVIPVGERYQQTLYSMRKKDGKLVEVSRRPTLFVPMTGRAEERREVQPDPLHPATVNGSFEEDASQVTFIPGWFYERQVSWETDPKAPQGTHYIKFKNEQPGRSAHVLQGFPIDGSKVHTLELSAWVKHRNLQLDNKEDHPGVAVTLYDAGRKALGTWWIEASFLGTHDWRQVKISTPIRVPPATREGILRLGLFGATGELSLDDVRVTIKSTGK